jgi:hypothetical protein
MSMIIDYVNQIYNLYNKSDDCILENDIMNFLIYEQVEQLINENILTVVYKNNTKYIKYVK